jgi:WD40 repeat protein
MEVIAMRSIFFLLIFLTVSTKVQGQQPTWENTLTFGRGVPISAQWHPTGESILINTATGAWLIDGNKLTTIQSFPELSEASFSPDGRWMVGIQSIDTMRVYEARTWKIVLEVSGYRSAYFGADGHSLIATELQTGDVDAWQLGRFRGLLPLDPHELVPRRWIAFAISPNGKYRAELDREFTLSISQLSRIWEPGTNISLGRRADLQWSPDSSKLLLAYADNTFEVLDTITYQRLPQPIGLADEPIEDRPQNILSWSGNSQYILRNYPCCHMYRHAQIFDIFTGQVVFEPMYAPHWTTTISPDGHWFADGSHLYDSATREDGPSFSGNPGGSFGIWSSNSQKLALSSDDFVFELTIVNLQKHTTLLLRGHRTFNLGTSWSPESERLLTWDANGIIMLWDASTGQRLADSYDFARMSDQAILSPDGRYLAVSDKFGLVRVWETSSGELISSFGAEHLGALGLMAWQPGGTLLVTNTYNGHLNQIPDDGTPQLSYIWDGLTGELVDKFIPYPSDFFWSPDGSTLFATQRNGQLYLWQSPVIETSISLSSRSFVPNIDIEQMDKEGFLYLQSFGGHGERYYDRVDLMTTEDQLGIYTGHAVHLPNASEVRIAHLSCNYQIVPVVCQLSVRQHDLAALNISEGHETIPQQGPTLIEGSFSPPIGPTYWSPQGLYFGLQMSDGLLDIWRIDSTLQLERMVTQRSVGHAVWSFDERLLALERTTHELDVMDMETGAYVFTMDGGHIYGWSPDSQFLQVGYANETSYLWDVDREIAALRFGTGSPDGPEDQIPVWSDDGRVMVDIAGGAVRLWQRI